jgi:hypothetical protein
MSDADVKAPDSLAESAELNSDDSNSFDLAQELIRALDKASNRHMEQISAGDKGR